MNTPQLTVHVVDDDELFRNAIGRLLRAANHRVALYESGNGLLDRLAEMEPGCLLLDMRMPDVNGLQLQERLNALDSILPIIFLTGHGDVPMAVHAIKAGAHDLLVKPVDKTTLLETIGRAFARYRERHERRERLNGMQRLLDSLTRREREVFGLVVRGKLSKQIAFELGISERTIKAHRRSVMQKLQVQSLAEAVLIAEKLGIVGSNQ